MFCGDVAGDNQVEEILYRGGISRAALEAVLDHFSDALVSLNAPVKSWRDAASVALPVTALALSCGRTFSEVANAPSALP